MRAMTYDLKGLTADQVNMIANALGDRPFKESAGVIHLIKQQVMAQEEAVRAEAAKKVADDAAAKAAQEVVDEAKAPKGANGAANKTVKEMVAEAEARLPDHNGRTKVERDEIGQAKLDATSQIVNIRPRAIRRERKTSR